MNKVCSSEIDTVKQAVHRVANHIQGVLGWLELADYGKALISARDAGKALAGLLRTLYAMHAMTVPRDGGLVVPHGTTILGHEDVNVDVADDEIMTVTHGEIRTESEHKGESSK
jgi:hypothetical protein